jgi:hypothetical protein
MFLKPREPTLPFGLWGELHVPNFSENWTVEPGAEARAPPEFFSWGGGGGAGLEAIYNFLF